MLTEPAKRQVKIQIPASKKLSVFDLPWEKNKGP